MFWFVGKLGEELSPGDGRAEGSNGGVQWAWMLLTLRCGTDLLAPSWLPAAGNDVPRVDGKGPAANETPPVRVTGSPISD
jgi:hypothetical protein